MSNDLPIVDANLKTYLESTLGSNIVAYYLSAVSTPQEDYTLHVFNNYDRVDSILEAFREYEYQAKLHPEFHNVIVCKPKGPFQLQHDHSLKEIIVDNRASEMIYQGADVFVPGVKRANRVQKNDAIMVKGQHGIIVAKAKALMSHNDILSSNKGIAAKNLLSPFRVPSLSELHLEKFPVFFQSLPAFLVSLNLEPTASDKILDCCAAPGNKTIHLSELTHNKASIVAVDRSKSRLNKLEQKCKQFKLSNIHSITGNIIELSKKWTLKFDKIIVDPPCTALGLRPKLAITTSKKVIESTSRYQKAILFAACKLLKPGGIMIYSTCTITIAENEEIIDYALSELGLKILDQSYVFSDVLSLSDFSFPVQRFIPGIHKTVGYFIAKLQKC